ncbi:Thrombospondin type-1 domain-containing protein 4 [Pteropus alecto]|uniref:Thrombospondin type-1 domain-containing protein 4 n=1 Tax=Pteropus alecto TaxID=9402 RepID=L5JWU9_PTEAL|nr:Thrombospondin type-1 domain-containing protein 4 [Pteropus alecto]
MGWRKKGNQGRNSPRVGQPGGCSGRDTKGQESTKEEVVVCSVNAAEKKTRKANSPDECTRHLLHLSVSQVKGNRKCELNCQAMGYRFYVRQAEKVIDGTPCDQNGTAICVSGQCKTVACYCLHPQPMGPPEP